MNFAEIDDRWEAIQRRFQEICILRRRGDNAQAGELMEKALSPLIVEWSTQDGSPPEEKRRRLQDMFEHEMDRIESAWTTREVLAKELFAPLKLQLSELVEKAGRLTPTAAPAGNAVGSREVAALHAELKVLRSDVAKLQTLLEEPKKGATTPNFVAEAEAAHRNQKLETTLLDAIARETAVQFEVLREEMRDALSAETQAHEQTREILGDMLLELKKLRATRQHSFPQQDAVEHPH